MADHIRLYKNGKELYIPITKEDGRVFTLPKRTLFVKSVKAGLITRPETQGYTLKNMTEDEIAALFTEETINNYDYVYDNLKITDNGTVNRSDNTIYESADFDGITISSYESSDMLKMSIFKKIVNLNVNAPGFRVYYDTATEYYKGNIVSTGSTFKLHSSSYNWKLEEAAGDLIVTNVRELVMFAVSANGSITPHWPNVLDIRNIDTTYCTSMTILTGQAQSCWLILGNFDTSALTTKPKVLYLDTSGDDNHPVHIVVMTTLIPPKLKNCKFSGDTKLDEFDKTYDFIAQNYRIHKILVPYEAYENYINDTFYDGENPTVGLTGCSRYGLYGEQYGGRNIIETYQQGEYDERPDKKWFYRKEL